MSNKSKKRCCPQVIALPGSSNFGSLLQTETILLTFNTGDIESIAALSMIAPNVGEITIVSGQGVAVLRDSQLTENQLGTPLANSGNVFEIRYSVTFGNVTALGGGIIARVIKLTPSGGRTVVDEVVLSPNLLGNITITTKTVLPISGLSRFSENDILVVIYIRSAGTSFIATSFGGSTTLSTNQR